MVGIYLLWRALRTANGHCDRDHDETPAISATLQRQFKPHPRLRLAFDVEEAGLAMTAANRGEHAFLLPEGRSLLFVAKGKVFAVK